MSFFSRLKILIQYILPQHALSQWAGKIADSRITWLKNICIYLFLKKFPVDMSEAKITDAYAYPSFNDFFIRELQLNLRPLDRNAVAIVSPVDGVLAQNGSLKAQQFLQAKGFYFDLTHLLGGKQTLSDYFNNGLFASFYLAPHNYHRVHMPIDGQLIKTIFVPGNLFSVNTKAAEIIPQLYARNERLICVFETAIGQMAIILVGALIVGSITTKWRTKPYRTKVMVEEDFSDQRIKLQKGDELGYFKMGSTVILLFAKDTMTWSKQAGNESHEKEVINVLLHEQIALLN